MSSQENYYDGLQRVIGLAKFPGARQYYTERIFLDKARGLTVMLAYPLPKSQKNFGEG